MSLELQKSQCLPKLVPPRPIFSPADLCRLLLLHLFLPLPFLASVETRAHWPPPVMDTGQGGMGRTRASSEPTWGPVVWASLLQVTHHWEWIPCHQDPKPLLKGGQARSPFWPYPVPQAVPRHHTDWGTISALHLPVTVNLGPKLAWLSLSLVTCETGCMRSPALPYALRF